MMINRLLIVAILSVTFIATSYPSFWLASARETPLPLHQVIRPLNQNCLSFASADFSFTPAMPHVGETISFTGQATLSGTLSLTGTGTLTGSLGSLLVINYTWRFGDGQQGAGAQIEHTYMPTFTAQSFGVVMTATNACGDYVTVNKTVQLRQNVLYLPVIHKQYCSPFIYNETLDYNLTIIKASDAWACSAGQGTGIVVAVIDTGVDLDHTELAANMVPGETFIEDTTSPNDDQGHGSHVAGIIAAIANNGGAIGVAPNAQIMPIKVLDSQGSGYTSGVAAGVIWATDNGADIINLSLGGVNSNAVLEDAINYAADQGVLLVASGGNCGDNSYYLNGCTYQDQPNYPAALPPVIAVAATTSTDLQASYSNQGSYIEVAAPGNSIYSSYLNGGYAYLSGTSQATPHVAGLAALIWSNNPTWSSEQVRLQLQDTAIDLGDAGFDTQFGYGRINALAAIGLSNRPVNQPSRFNHFAHINLTVYRPATSASHSFAPGRVLVKLAPGTQVVDFVNRGDASGQKMTVLNTVESLNLVTLAVTPGTEEDAIQMLVDTPGVLYATLDYVVHSH